MNNIFLLKIIILNIKVEGFFLSFMLILDGILHAYLLIKVGPDNQQFNQN